MMCEECIAYILQYSLHQSDGGLGILDKLVFGFLDVETGLLAYFARERVVRLETE